MSANQRLKEVVKEIRYREGVTQKTITEQLGFKSATYLSDLISGRSAVTEQFAESISEVYSYVNPRWLLTGEGSMLVGDDEVEEQREEDMVLYYPDIPATASGIEDMPEPSWDDMQPQALYIPQFGGCKALKAWGDSMYPKINSGDIVVFSEWLENYVQNGEIYLIITRNGERMFKYLSELPREEGEERMFECLSANPDQRRYSPFKILASDIVKLYRVRGRIQEI